ncbi:hypothetical protein YC2023_094918 [Brassica napus]
MIEGAKQRMMIELKKQRMETAKELELQQMKMSVAEWNFPSVKDAADVVIATMMSGIQRPANVWNTKTLEADRQSPASLLKTGIHHLQAFDRETLTDQDKDREMRITCDIREHKEGRPMS